jgi:hypothetical protein
MRRKSRKTKLVTLPAEYARGFIYALDRRTELARAVKEQFLAIAEDLGGLNSLSTIKRSLVEKFVWLSQVMNRLEGDMAQTTDPKASGELVARWTQAVNSLQGLARALGTERRASSMPWLGVVENEKGKAKANGKHKPEGAGPGAPAPPQLLKELDQAHADAAGGVDDR